MIHGELIQIEDGADMHYGDPQFKDHSIVSLWNQYDRLLRRIQFPADLPPELSGAENGLAIEALNKHPAIEELQVTGTKANSFAPDIDKDLHEIDRQQAWHHDYGPVHRCGFRTLAFGNEPWKLIELEKREQPNQSAAAPSPELPLNGDRRAGNLYRFQPHNLRPLFIEGLQRQSAENVTPGKRPIDKESALNLEHNMTLSTVA